MSFPQIVKLVLGLPFMTLLVFEGLEIIPQIPSKDQQIRVLIASDAMNEIDDIWGISLAILFPDRFKIEGFIGGNFDHTHLGVVKKVLSNSPI